jgi:hypothetical protein
MLNFKYYPSTRLRMTILGAEVGTRELLETKQEYQPLDMSSISKGGYFCLRVTYVRQLFSLKAIILSK